MGGSAFSDKDDAQLRAQGIPNEILDQAQAVARILAKAKTVLVTAHADPDGDACGSSLAMTLALRELGKQVLVYDAKPYPQDFAWLPGASSLQNHVDADARFDATVICDAGSIERTGPDLPDATRRGTLCWVDHHRNDNPPGDVNYVDTLAPAAGEQVREVIRALGHPLSLDVAKCLYSALITDTGGFRYSNTTPRALSLASELVAQGVSPWEMTERIYESQPVEKIKLLAQVLPSLEVSSCGRYASLVIRQKDFDSTGASSELTDGFVNFPRSIAGVEVAVQFRERGQGYKLSFRSRGRVDVAAIARGLGGGGHKNAAGGFVEGDLLQAKSVVFAAIESVLNA